VSWFAARELRLRQNGLLIPQLCSGSRADNSCHTLHSSLDITGGAAAGSTVGACSTAGSALASQGAASPVGGELLAVNGGAQTVSPSTAGGGGAGPSATAALTPNTVLLDSALLAQGVTPQAAVKTAALLRVMSMPQQGLQQTAALSQQGGTTPRGGGSKVGTMQLVKGREM
jgi:hypothetical protein